MFWTEDIYKLFDFNLIPNDFMSIDDKLNTLTRLIVFIFFIIALITNDFKIISLMLILIIFIIVIYYLEKQYKTEAYTYLNEKNKDVIDNKFCKKPSVNNPFMNPMLMDDINDEACPIDNEKIDKMIDKYYDTTMFRNVDDIYDRTTSKRQFYSVPIRQKMNDQEGFAKWLYYTGKSCKENNGEQCYQNIYTDLRM